MLFSLRRGELPAEVVCGEAALDEREPRTVTESSVAIAGLQKPGAIETTI